MCSNISRRQFMMGLGGCAGYIAASPMLSPLQSGLAWASTSCTSNRKVLVHLFLDGGLDSASLLIPRNISAYFDKRPNIAVRNSLMLDSRYGLHPNLTNLSSLVGQGRAAIVNKVGYPRPTRSHEDSKNVYAKAIRGVSSNTTGWAGRFGDTYCLNNPNIASVFSFRGNVKELSSRNYVPTTAGSLASFNYSNDADANDSRYRRNIIRDTRPLEAVANDQTRLHQNAWSAVDASVDVLQAINRNYTSPVTYQNDGLSQRFRDAAKLIRDPDANPSIILLSQGGYDTHGDSPAAHARLFRDLNNAIGSFMADLDQMGRANDVVTLVFTEFGRNSFENSTQGTDHGHGTMALVIGNPVAGGVAGPEYNNDDFANQQWLPGDVDFREILSEVIGEHLGVDPNPLFPEAYARTGLSIIR